MSASLIVSKLRDTIEAIGLGAPIIHDNDPEGEPDSGLWVRFKANIEKAKQISGAGSKQRATGIAEAFVFSPLDTGDKDGLTLANTIRAAFRTLTVAPLVFRSPSVFSRGRQGRWWVHQVLIPWHADESHPGAPVLAATPVPDPLLEDTLEVAAIARTRFAQAFPAVVVLHDNAPGEEPDAGPWVGFMVTFGTSNQMMAGSANKRYRTEGELVIQVHSELQQGDNAAITLADSIANTFRGVSVGLVTFKAVTPGNADGTAVGGPSTCWCPFTLTWWIDR